MKNITLFCSAFALSSMFYMHAKDSLDVMQAVPFQESSLSTNLKEDNIEEHETFNSTEDDDNTLNSDTSDDEHDAIEHDEDELNNESDELNNESDTHNDELNNESNTHNDELNNESDTHNDELNSESDTSNADTNEHALGNDEVMDDNHTPYYSIDKNLAKQIEELNQKVSALAHSMLYRPITVNTTIKKETPPPAKEEKAPPAVAPKAPVKESYSSTVFIHRGNKQTEIHKM